MKIILILFVLLMTGQSYAWYERGNGGFMVACPGHVPRTLDLHELENRYGLHLDPGHDTALDERVNYLISKIQKLNPRRAELYQTWFKTFITESQFVPNVKFSSIGDVGKVELPANCELQQVIFQRETSPMNEWRYTIDLNLWKQLSLVDQAALVLHELIYRELTGPLLPQMTSESTRHFNALVNSTEFNGFTPRDYLLRLQDINVINADYQGIAILLSARQDENSPWIKLPLSFHDNGQPLMVTLDGSSDFEWDGKILESFCRIFSPYNSAAKVIPTIGVLKFSQDGQPQSITPLAESDGPVLVERCQSAYEKEDGRRILRNEWSFKDGALEL
jgi:hypothetical protein